MKTIMKTSLTALGLTTFTLSCLGGYIGTSAGYIIDGNGEKNFAIQSGTAVIETATTTHNFELELAFSDASEQFTETIEGENLNIKADAEVIPQMANYDVRTHLRRDLNLYGGAGIGYAFYNISGSTYLMGENLRLSDSGGSFAWQFMAGIVYRFSEKTSLRLGYRYINLDDVNFIVDGFTYGGDSYTLDEALSSGEISSDENVLEVGLLFKF